MSRQMLACTSPLPIGKSISNPACCIFPQPIKLVLYRGCLILQQSTKSATQRNAMQIKKIAVALSGGKRTRLTIQQPRHVRILNFSSGFASLLRCTEYAKCSIAVVLSVAPRLEVSNLAEEEASHSYKHSSSTARCHS